MMWNGKSKALTFSFDDGVAQDKRLVEIFRAYGMRCTFNLNSGIQTATNGWEDKGVKINRMNMKGLPQLYAGHEIAVHSLTHPDLTKYDEETIYNELYQDKRILEQVFEQPVVGMAYPYGTFNDTVVSVIKQVGLKYARTVWSTGKFLTPSRDPERLLRLPATSHCQDANLMELGKRFLELSADPEHPQIFYVWGHSYEYDVNHNWENIEAFCKLMAGQKDIFYGTNAQVLLEEV